tara:strand:- start:155 stop:319 length:165 start_codon:yes stop_codon:yes gene_type:complete
MSNKQIIREAEEEIEGILQDLQDRHSVRPFRILCDVSNESGKIEITIIKDGKYK